MNMNIALLVLLLVAPLIIVARMALAPGAPTLHSDAPQEPGAPRHENFFGLR